jgi:hypothetical protein
MGRVDGLVLELRDGAPPRITHLEIGGEPAMRRLAGWLGRLAEALGRWTGEEATRGPARLPWEVVTVVGKYVELDVESEDTAAMALEVWLRDHVVAKVPLT